jgi:hypothetical protein
VTGRSALVSRADLKKSWASSVTQVALDAKRLLGKVLERRAEGEGTRLAGRRVGGSPKVLPKDDPPPSPTSASRRRTPPRQ